MLSLKLVGKNRLVSGVEDFILLWDVESGICLWKIPAHDGYIVDIDKISDTCIASVGYDKKI